MFDSAANNNWKSQKIIKFERHKGGDLSGKAESYVLTALDETHARLVYSETSGTGQEPVVTELSIDVQPLVEVKELFLKYEMYRWTNRAFSLSFSSDRPTICYSFTFERGTVQFSSQFFPKPFAEKLSELDAILSKQPR